MEDRFYIGQDVVSVGTMGQIKDGIVYQIKSLRAGICKCSPLLVDIGFAVTQNGNVVGLRCGKCGARECTSDRTDWYCSTCFRPLDSLTNIEELTEILEQPIENYLN